MLLTPRTGSVGIFSLEFVVASPLTVQLQSRWSLRLHPHPYRDQNEEYREHLLQLRARQALRDSGADPRTEEEPERDPQRRSDVEVPPPPVLPCAKRPHWQQQRAKRRSGRKLRLKFR